MNINIKVNETKNFYNRYPIADDKFRFGNSVLSMENIRVNIKELEGKKILDCGCGPGNISTYIASILKNAHIVSMDISINSLKILKNRLKNINKKCKVSLLLGNILKPSFKDEVFDFIIVAGVIHHTPKPLDAFINLSKMLKKGGKMYLSVYNKKSFYFFEFNTIGKIFRYLYKKGIKLNFFVRLFRLLLIVISREKVYEEQSMKIFADRYLTPVASFHTQSEIKKWCEKKDLKIIKKGTCKLGTLIWFLIEK